jgi:large subunit ribosomal protein L18e
MLIRFLKKAASINNAEIWRTVAEFVERPRRKRVVVNVGKIDRLVKDGDIVIVPGKILGGGEIRRKITVAAVSITPTAASKILSVGGEVLTIPELVKKVPKGSGVKIVV